MRVLALETSGRIGTLATLEVDGEQISTVGLASLAESQRTAQSLVPEIQQLLKTSTWTPNQLDLICVATGPGSFTGLRIGVTTAKTLAYASEAKLAEVHTLAAIAAGVSQPFERLWTILDAQRQELFVAQFKQGWNEGAESYTETRIVGVEQWLQELKEGDAVCGPPLRAISGRLPSGVNAVSADAWSPQAEIVGRLGIGAHQSNNLVDPVQLVPHYYRKSAAEEKADLRSQDVKSN